VIEIGEGEKIKNLTTLKNVFRSFLDLGMDRFSFVIGMGGGVVCDITGLAASTYMRGIRFGLVPTTLLAQVDASIGGKNGINLNGYKNIIGVFKQPEFIQCDFAFLKSLQKQELLCGIAEIIKHAAVQSLSLFDFLEHNWQKLLSLQEGVVKKTVEESIRIKSSIVRKDETEKGERRILNFGHTLGHALEKAGSFPHGEAVSMGMVFAARMSVSRGLITEGKAARLERLLDTVGLPTRIPVKSSQLIDAVRKDKKRQGEFLHFILLRDLGKATAVKLSYPELEEWIHDLCEHC